jgi:DNA-binding transcriptional LysR family regulator
MELRQLRYFVAVARHGGFTSAAQELWLTQSALSQQVRRLEAEVGVALLRRTPRGVQPTAAGEELLVRAEAILAEVARARADLDHHAGATRGRVRVAATAADAVTLPAALAAFHRAHPGIQVALRHGAAREVAALVARGSADVAVVALAAQAPAGTTVVSVAEEPLRVMAAADDALARPGSAVALADLRDRPFILPEPGSPLRDAILHAAQAAGFSPVPLFEVGEPSAVRHLAAAGLGIAIVPAAWFALAGPPVAELALAQPAPRHRVAVLAPEAGPSPAGRLLLHHLARA